MPTPMARLWVSTVTTTVTTITTLLLGGWRRRLRIDSQLKVPMETMIITATRAAMGMRDTQSPRNTTNTSSTTPAIRVDNRVRPPDFMLITDWPIMAQPAMPPRKPEATLAIPWPRHSRCLSLSVSVRSSTMVAVIIDSSRPTTAMVSDTGKMMRRVSRDRGMSGNRNTGRLSGSAPLSPTVGISRPKYTATPVSTRMHTSGDGTARVSSGNR